jgi:hypothetical protein
MDGLDRRIAKVKRSIAEQVSRLRREAGDTRWLSDKQAIKSFVRARRIATVYHFTPVENLPSMCE